MDLALNNQQRLIRHKTQPTNQPTQSTYISLKNIKIINSKSLFDHHTVITLKHKKSN